MSGTISKARQRLKSGKAKYDKVKGKYDKAKGQYDKFKEYYDLVNNLLDEDTRQVTVAQESVKIAIKYGEKLLGRSIGNHPYFKYHEKHLEMLWSAIQAANTAANAKKTIKEAIAMSERVRTESIKMSKTYSPKYSQLRSRIASKLSGPPFHWHKYLRKLMQQGFANSSHEAISEECIYIYSEWVGPLLNRVTPEVKEIQQTAKTVLVEYGAIMSYCRTIQTLISKYQNKVSGLQQGDSDISVVAGKSEEQRRDLERVSAINNPNSKSSQAVLDPVKASREAMKTAKRCASDWMLLGEMSRGEQILKVGAPAGAIFPWEMAQRLGVRVPGFH